MRFLFLLMTALCLSLLSFGAAAHAHAGLQGQVATVAARTAAVQDKVTEVAALPSVDEMGRVIAPGDDGLHDEDAIDDPPPGYCNIWSADLLDPLDLLDEIEESSALFGLPTVKLLLRAEDFWQAPAGRTEPPATAFFKPPISLA
ncbi:cobalt-zinc-cadmium resistance protein [Cupriavidus sp. WKF15]|uniref:cobalt-zinc-cadmium resistance protein n=1 Tax=Cupriavidus sp. WKF15 TaxID=3032282 RepID=UPI0023E32CD8|nr:cobalt-zinc-cadmium resistance protein [Cupriavidus sp. WKF15]WER48085.1 cobalt-zinc-cadmium resistance protein [Cupriavidus sp. WKF15]